jgi:uncharacterized protein (DUF1501 family)
MDDQHGIDCGCEEYNELSRRQFITASAGVASAAAFFPAWLPKIVMSNHYASNRDIIVSVFMRGGADGLSIAVPFADPNYYSSRSTIAIPRPDSSAATKGINLDGFFMFPQAMAGNAAGTGGLMPAFLANDLLIVHATGQLNNSRSHFDAQRYMEVGKPVDPALVTGWLGRHLASMPPMKSDSLLRGIGLSNGLQKTLVGAPKTLPIADPTKFSIGGLDATQSQRIAFLQGDYTPADEPMHSAALDATNTVALLKSVNFAGYTPANGAVYPDTARSAFSRALKSVATLIKADVGIEAAQVDIGGWDTHNQQDPLAGQMFNTMRDFSNSLGAFYADVIASGYNVTVVAISEFGRNVRENGSQGTDHGRGTTMFAMGKGIAGGRVLVKNWPGLAREQLEQGQDLKVTVDYRDILAEIVKNRLANPNLDLVFPTWTPTFLGVTR